MLPIVVRGICPAIEEASNKSQVRIDLRFMQTSRRFKERFVYASWTFEIAR